MRFSAKVKPDPLIGDERIRNGFVIYKRIGDDIRVLEFARWREKYVGCWRPKGWEGQEWLS